MEYEVVSHPFLPGIRVFTVEIFSRSAHSHREYELCLLLRGGIRIESRNETIHLNPGRLVLFSPRQPHAFQAEAEGALLLILQASPQFCAAYFPQAAQLRFAATVDLPGEETLRAALLRLGRLCFARPVGCEFAAMAEINGIFARLITDIPWHTEPQQADRGAARVTRIAARIEADYAEPLRLHALAAEEGVSADYLSHAFRQYLGRTFQDYLSQVRLEHAAALLESTTLTITDICTACGYSSPRYLNADFRRRYGCTPAAHRAGAPLHEVAAADIGGTRERFYSSEEALQVLDRLGPEYLPTGTHT